MQTLTSTPFQQPVSHTLLGSGPDFQRRIASTTATEHTLGTEAPQFSSAKTVRYYPQHFVAATHIFLTKVDTKSDLEYVTPAEIARLKGRSQI